MSQRDKLSTAPGRAFAKIPNAVLLAIELLVLFAVLAAAWKERSAMPLVPITDPDTWGYLNPALCWLSGLGFQQTDGRDWLYPALVAPFLKSTGSFAGIVLWQRFLGIASGLLMAVTWRCWVSTLPFQRRILFLLSLMGALPILIQLMNPQTIFFETTIRPEAVMSFFVYAELACLMGYYKYRWQTPKAGHSTVLGAAVIVLSYACLLLKPSWLLAFIVTSAPVFLGIIGRVLPLRTRLLTPFLGVIFSLVLLRLPPAFFLIKDRDSVILQPNALFGVHAKLIESMLAARLAALPDSDPEKTKLHELVAVLESELHVAENRSGTFEKLGFDADYLSYESPLVPAIFRYVGNDDKKFRAFCISCYRDAALHDPLAFSRKIFVQFTYFLFPKPDTFFRDRTDYWKFYRDSTESLDSFNPERFRGDAKKMYLQYKAELVAEAQTPPRLKSEFHSFRQVFAALALPLEILFFLTFATSLIWAPLRDLRLAGWAAASLFFAPLGNAVTVSIAHVLDNSRYRCTYGGFLLFALVAMALFSFLVIVHSLLHAVEVRSKGSARAG